MTRKRPLIVLMAILAALLVAAVMPAAFGNDGRDPGSSPGTPVPDKSRATSDKGTDDRDVKTRDQVINDDLIVDGSICAGLDCANGESFGFDTLRLKENNLRIKFEDTSSSASFPTNDWQITVNDSSNGGQEKFSIDDISNSRTPFTIEASAPTNSLYVDDGGRIGLGTGVPVVDVHVRDGDTPTYRMEQDGSSGFTAQTWDIAGNETNFFVRDVTNGSRLPLRIRPNAPSNSIFVDTNGRLGFGTSAPVSPVDINVDGSAVGTGNSALTIRKDSGAVAIQIVNDTTGAFWNITYSMNADELRFSRSGTGETEMILDANGNLTVFGNVCAANVAGSC